MTTPPSGRHPEPGDPADPLGTSDPFTPRYWEQPVHSVHPDRPTSSGYPVQPARPDALDRSADRTGASKDPLAPDDFGGWFALVFGAIGRSFPRLLAISAVPGAVFAAFLVALGNTMPGQAEIAERFRSDPDLTGDPSATITFLFGESLPMMAVFTVIGALAGALAQAASFFVIVLEARGQPTNAGEAMRFARGAVLPLVGWSFVGGLLIGAGYLLLVVPGLYLSVMVPASVCGVVIIEGGGIARCFQLINGRFWRAAGRLLTAAAIVFTYSIAAGVLTGLAMLVSPALGGLVQVLALLPSIVFFNAVYVVTYAELRRRENAAVTTATLAHELIRA